MKELVRNYKFLLVLFPLVSGIALLAAFTSEYLFGLKPCHLCTYQRIPYAVMLAVYGLLVGIFATGKVKLDRKSLSIILVAYSLIFFADASIAGYHTGVEKGVFAGPDSCGGGNSGAQTTEDLLKSILQASIVSCKDPAFIFLGLSMAAWNALYASFWGVISLLILVQIRKWPTKKQ